MNLSCSFLAALLLVLSACTTQEATKPVLYEGPLSEAEECGNVLLRKRSR
jgi:hypothetical protein